MSKPAWKHRYKPPLILHDLPLEEELSRKQGGPSKTVEICRKQNGFSTQGLYKDT